MPRERLRGSAVVIFRTQPQPHRHLVSEGILDAIDRHDTPKLFDWIAPWILVARSIGAHEQHPAMVEPNVSDLHDHCHAAQQERSRR
jgi:hypothetical protein